MTRLSNVLIDFWYLFIAPHIPRNWMNRLGVAVCSLGVFLVVWVMFFMLGIVEVQP